MRTNSPPDCWQAIHETEREEQDKKSDRQRGACKEGMKKLRQNVRNDETTTFLTQSQFCFFVLFGGFQWQRTVWPVYAGSTGEMDQFPRYTLRVQQPIQALIACFSKFTNIISLNFISFRIVPLAFTWKLPNWAGGASEQMGRSRRHGLNLLAKNWPCYPLHNHSVHFYFSRNRGAMLNVLEEE